MTAEEIVSQLRELPSSDEQLEFLHSACRGDDSLLEQVRELLSERERTALAGRDVTIVHDSGSAVPASGVMSHTGDMPSSENSSNEPAPKHEFSEGQRVGNYKLLQLIGQGGMGVVYMAEQVEPVRRRVAFKVIKPGMGSHEAVARFESERQALAMMSNENIARVLDAGTTPQGSPYFVMELVKGLPVIQYCDRARLSLSARLELFIPICHALQHAHQKGIIHRDIKPSNILVAPHDGRPVPKVIDFGLAKALQEQSLTDKTLFTRFGQVVGTLAYMSPEQAEMNALDVDTRSDIYSLGVLLYELITGSTPLERRRVKEQSFDQVLKIIREEEPARPSTRLTQSGPAIAEISAQRQIDPKQLTATIRGDLDWIVMKALEKDRARRYQTAADLADDIQRLLNDEMVEARPPTTAYRVNKFVRRHRAAVWTCIAFLSILVAATAGSVWLAIRAINAEHLAELRLDDANRSSERARQERDHARQAESRAIEAEQEALTESAIANAVSDFLQEDLLDQASPSNEPDRDIKLTTILHRASDRIEGRFTDQPLVEAEIRRTLGGTLADLGEYSAAEVHFEKSWKLRQQELGDDADATLDALQSLALLKREQGHLAEAESIYRTILTARRTQDGKGSRSAISAMSGLATVLQLLDNYDEAQEMYETVLAIRREELGDTHSQTLSCMNNLAALYRARKDYDKARPLYEHVVSIRRETLGNEHPKTLTSINNLALLLKSEGQLEEALKLYEETISIRQRVLGDEHPDTLTTANNLASVLRSLKRYDEAEALYAKNLEARRRILGEEHLDAIRSLNNLAYFYLHTKDYERAAELYEQTLEVRTRVLGAEHSSTMSTVEALARVYKGQNRTEDATRVMTRLLAYRRKTLGNEHIETYSALNDLALLLFNADQYEQSIPLLTELLASRVDRQSESRKTSLSNALARAQQAVGNYELALPLYQAALAGYRTRTDDDDSRSAIARTLGRIGTCQIELSQFVEAEAVARESVALRTELAPDDWRLFNSRGLLGEALSKQRKFAAAESELLAAWEGLESRADQMASDSHSQRLNEACERIVELYEAWDRPADAEIWSQRIIASPMQQDEPVNDGDSD